jgi:hypothetical protein
MWNCATDHKKEWIRVHMCVYNKHVPVYIHGLYFSASFEIRLHFGGNKLQKLLTRKHNEILFEKLRRGMASKLAAELFV